MSGQWHPKQDLEALGGARAKPPKRSVRVADAIKNELTVLLLQRSRDPRLERVHISSVEVSDDLRHAKIYYTVGNGRERLADVRAALERASGFMRSHLARTINLRFTPELRFWYDEKAEHVEKVERLLAEIARENDERTPRT